MSEKIEIPIDLVPAQTVLNQFDTLLQNLPNTEGHRTEPLNLTEANKLIQQFKQIQFPKGHRKSFIEIMGLNHLENVSSKTLAFFLDTTENHDLEDLVLNSLLKAAGKEIGYQLHSKKIIREKSTDKGRVDLWIETSDFIIVIENKIKHHADNNPFPDYIAHAQANNEDAKELIFILLAIDKPNVMPNGFKFVSHFDLSKQILNALGHKSLQADQYYLTYLIDYISAIEKLNPNSEYGKMQMDIVNFYRNNREVLEKIESEENKESVYQYYEQRLQEINSELQELGLELFPENVEFNKNDDSISEIGGSYDTNSFEVKENLQLEFEIYKGTGYTNLWLRRFSGPRMKKNDYLVLQEILKQEKISFIEQDGHYEALLLEENESISAKEFADKAAPLIRKILEIHNIQTTVA